LTEPRLTVVEHPLIQHKLGYLRDKETPTVHFRKLANEITLLLTYEATKDMPTEGAEVETPLEPMTVQRISGK
jgi:uracil phosphoribosyltransferase